MMNQCTTDTFNEGIEASVLRASTSLISRLKSAAPTKDIIILGVIMSVLSILDGILTGIGISNGGIAAEGNPVIRNLMHEIGYVNALVLIKSFALFVVGLICFLSSQVKWVGLALKGMIALYLIAAILPWSVILLSNVG